MNPASALKLEDQQCRPLEGGKPLNATGLVTLLTQVPGWKIDEGKLTRQFDCGGFDGTMAFVNALAWVSRTQDHHPDVQFVYDKVRIAYDTHSVGGLSENDFICAAKVSALFAQREATH
jgi:4a-hydroxytetrahydrobiopterin dehydratase